MSATRIYKKGDFFIFQENEDLTKINTLNTVQTSYRFQGRHFFDLNGQVKYSFVYSDIRNEFGKIYESEEIFVGLMMKSSSDFRSDQVINRIVSDASTNANLIRAGITRLFGGILTNNAITSLYVKYYNKATVPIVGTDVPVITLTVKTKETTTFDLGDDGIKFDKGLAIAITGAIPDTDTTAIGANEMFVQSFIEGGQFFYETMASIINATTTLVGAIGKRVSILGISNSVSTFIGVLTEQLKMDGVSNGVTSSISVLTGKANLGGTSNNSVIVTGIL
jgi:hypothetical protein